MSSLQRHRQVRIVLMWSLQAQFSGYALARRAVPEIELVPRPATATPIEEIVAGRAEFAIASPSHMLAAGDVGRDVLLAALIMPRSPIVGAARRGTPGATLKGARGLRIGVWASEDAEIRAMMIKAGANPDDNEFIPVGDDVTPLVRGEIDVLQATTYNEVPLLVAAGLPLDEMVLHRPDDYGVGTAKDGLVVHRRLVEENPSLVHAVVDAVVDGWRATLADPAAAIAEVCDLVPTLDPAVQQDQLEIILGLIDPERSLGQPLPEDLARAVEVHQTLGRSVSSSDIAIFTHEWGEAGA